MPHRPGLALFIALALSLSACKIVKTSDTASKSETGGGASDQSDMAARVDGMWDAEIMPHLEKAATELTGLKAAIASGLDAAGEAHGYRSQAEGSPWNFPVRFVGSIVAAKTDTRAATAEVDVDGDGVSDATVQLGPVIKGTTLRDVLPFVDFTAFRDQIEFAQLSRAMNTKAYDRTLAQLPRENLVGQRVAVLGAFTLKGADSPILVTPVTLEPAAGQ